VRQTLERIADKIDKEDLELLQKLIGTLVILTRMLRMHRATASRLRRFLGLGGSEKTEGIVGKEVEGKPITDLDPRAPAALPKEKKPTKGHGRISEDQICKR